MPIAMAGRFRIEGRRDNQSYRGRAVISECGAFHRIELHREQLEPIYGIGKREGSTLAFAAGPKDQVEIGVYHFDGPNLRGLWVPPDITPNSDLSVCGRELLVQTGADEYTIKEAHSITGEAYSGRIRLHPLDKDLPGSTRALKMEWILSDGTFHALALQSAGMIFAVFSFQPEAMHGVVRYELVDEGYQGTWINSLGQAGTEVLMQE